MKFRDLSEKKKCWLLLGTVIIGILAVYLINATKSGLWYDEAIEYYVSKYPNGSVPGMRTTSNMYERIVGTFQPPLYNWLMYLWLSIYDSEYWFRLAGILTTLIGSLGIFFGLREVSDYKWAIGGTAVYLLTGGISAYGLECAEYNLMLCMMSWTICCYLYFIKCGKTKHLLSFFFFACLTMYSQYGAVFIIVPLYASLFHFVIKHKKHLKAFIGGSVFALIAAFVLLYFFMFQQMERQGSINISHKPVFYYGMADIFVSIANTLTYVFQGSNNIQLVPVAAAGVLLIVSLRKNRLLQTMIVIFFCAWLLYYLATACNFYAHMLWQPDHLGTRNTGRRYCLFCAPLLIIMLVYGLFCTYELIRKKGIIRIGFQRSIIGCLALLFYFTGVVSIVGTKSKEDIRSAVQAWYQVDANTSITYINERDDANFQFYLTHNKNYLPEHQKNIDADTWPYNAKRDEIEKRLIEKGTLDLDEFYYLSQVKSMYKTSIMAFKDLMEINDYSIEEIKTGSTVLFHVTRLKQE